MPQVAKRSALNFILNNAIDLDGEHLMRVENHKNDRFLEIKRVGQIVLIKEDGYRKEIHEVEWKELKSLLNRLIEFEFPRSHKLRIKVRKQEETSNLEISPWSARKMS